jgi:serine/threonine protein phosphatase PrpC
MSLWNWIVGMFRPSRAAEPTPARKAGAPDLVDTAPLRAEFARRAGSAKPREAVEAGSAQSAGLEREKNEDAILMLYGIASGEEALPEFGLFCVADGAGGMGHGELASAIAVRTVAHAVMEGAFLSLMDLEMVSGEQPIEQLTRQAIERANEAVREGASGGVTTLTAAVMMNGVITIGHVGDSRAYLVDGNAMSQVTRDHSYAMRLVEIGQLPLEEAHDHPKRHKLWNAIGQGPNLRIDVESRPIPRSGYLLLCSDGLWGEVPDETLLATVASSAEPNATCEALVRAANDAGGADNISALVVAFPAG